MSRPVFVLGAVQTDFARNFAREGIEISAVFTEVIDQALAEADLEAQAIQSIHVGNAFGELFSAQSQLGAMPATVNPALWDVPATRHEAACASGSAAVLAGMTDVESGRYDCVLVLGVEQQRNVPGDTAAAYQGTAAWAGHDGVGERYMWAYEFNRLAEEYQRRYGLQYQHIAGIAKANMANAQRNPKAQTRRWQFSETSFTADDEANPVVHGILRRQDSGQVTDGAAAIILASPEFTDAYARERDLDPNAIARISGWGHRVASLSMTAKLERSRGDEYILPHLRGAITDMYKRAGISGPDDLDAIETHDCFSINEYMAIDHFGITPPGQNWRAVEDGTIAFDGRLPVNPSGGLIGTGHPVGATGVRMVADATRLVTGTAGDYQVPDCQRVATLNVGGSATTAISFLVEARAAAS